MSIYINHKQHDASDLVDENDKINDTTITSDESFQEIKNIRETLGNYVTSLGKTLIQEFLCTN